MEFLKFKKIPRLSRDCILTEKLDGSNAQVVIMSYGGLFENKTNSDDFLTPERVEGIKAEIERFIDKHCLSDLEEIKKSHLYENMTNQLFIFAGSRKRWLSVDNGKGCDNHGFARWVKENTEELLELGEGRFYGEFYGKGINRNYGLDHKRFALFNVGKWHKNGEEPRLISINSQTKEEKYTIPAPKCCETVPILYEGMFNTITIDTILFKLKRHGSYAVPRFMKPEGICILHKASNHLYKKTVENDANPKSV